MSELQTDESRKPGRSFFRIDVKTVMCLVVMSFMAIWLVRTVWEDSTEQNHFIRDLRSGNTADRREAARQLDAAPRPGEADKVVDALTRGLHDEDAEVREASASSLGSVVRKLVEGWKTRPDALRTKQPLVSKASRALIGLLNDGSDRARTNALLALIAIHLHRKQTTSGPGEPLCLGFDPSDEPLPRELRIALIETLGDPSPEVRGMAAVVLGELGPFLSHDIPAELFAALNDPAEVVRQQAGSACARYKDAIQSLLPDLFARLERAQPPFRSSLRTCLLAGSRRDPELVPFLRERLKSPSPDVRDCAAFMLGSLGPEAVDATPELLQVLNEPYTEEKPRRTPPDYQPNPPRSAIWALGKFPLSQAIIDGLVRSLRSDSPELHSSAAGYLASIGPAARKAVPALIAAMQTQLKRHDHKDGTIAYALSRLAPGTDHADQAITVLVDALSSKDADMRFNAAEALDRFGPRAKAAILSLKGLTNDATFVREWNQEVGQAARKSLAAIEPAPGPSNAPSR